jgi:cellulose synthase/poly-beta-1,6-N-acetylglucosamine synthase-like glycosyltransferase
VQVFVAGRGQACSQKIHNLLYCYEKISDDIDVLAFADSDICVQGNWLSHIVYPLRKSKNGAASGYRWFIPKQNNLASLALSAMNAKIAQLLGNTRFNQAWGGSMAIRVEVFRKLGLDKIWPKALSDDLSLSIAVKKAGLIVAFVPACLVASQEIATWRKLFEFARRQFLITRVSAPRTWWFGLCSGLYSILGIWAAAGLAIYAGAIQNEYLPIFAAVSVSVVFFVSQLIRAILRQKMAGKLLEHERQAMKAACAADILGFWLWSLLMLIIIISSAFGRTICWRGIRYKLLGPNETIVEGP